MEREHMQPSSNITAATATAAAAAATAAADAFAAATTTQKSSTSKHQHWSPAELALVGIRYAANVAELHEVLGDAHRLQPLPSVLLLEDVGAYCGGTQSQGQSLGGDVVGVVTALEATMRALALARRCLDVAVSADVEDAALTGAISYAPPKPVTVLTAPLLLLTASHTSCSSTSLDQLRRRLRVGLDIHLSAAVSLTTGTSVTISRVLDVSDDARKARPALTAFSAAQTATATAVMAAQRGPLLPHSDRVHGCAGQTAVHAKLRGRSGLNGAFRALEPNKQCRHAII